MEHMMIRKLEQIEKSLKESLLAEVSKNNKRLEDKLNEVINVNKSYAEIVRSSQIATNPMPTTSENSDQRTIMREEQNEQLADETDKKLCAPAI